VTVTAVAFDLGGVLTRSAFAGLDAHCASVGLPPGTLTRYFRGDPVMARLEVGEIGSRDFLRYVRAEVEAAHGVRLDIRALAAAAGEGERTRPEMLDLVAALRGRVATALVTNNVAEATWRAAFPFHLFDTVLDSSQIGVRKPDPRFYAELLTRLGRPAHEILFVDDFEENLVPAAALGMHTLHFDGAASCRAALVELGLLDEVVCA